VRWFVEHAFVLVPAQAIVGQHLVSFREFPPRQPPGSFNVQQAMEKLRNPPSTNRWSALHLMERNMKPNLSSPGIDRRVLLSTLAVLPALPALLTTASRAQAPANELASWNEGPAKQAIVDFVRSTTDRANPSFVPPEGRIATFDQDGTPWVEHPMYSQMMYCLDRVPVVAAQKPALKRAEPFKTVLSGNREAIAKLTVPELETIIVTTLTGMTADEFDAEWKSGSRPPRTRGGSGPIPSSPISPCRR
jgi:hypothetical protein